jgi:hypothetical protein
VFTKVEARTNPPGNRGSRLSTRVAKGVRWALLRAIPRTLAIEVKASEVATETRAATVTETCPTIEMETRRAIEVEVLVAIMTDTPRIIAEAWAAAVLLVARYP